MSVTDVPNLSAFEAAAARVLPKAVFDYFAGAAGDELALRESVEAFRRIRLRPHALVDVGARRLDTTFLGAPASMPLGVAPMAFQRLAHPEGERAMARAAGRAGVPIVLSALSTVAMEDVAREAAGTWWFQLYVYRDRGVTRELIARAAAAGCGAMLVTVDAPVQGRRERDIVNRFTLPDGIRMENLLPTGRDRFPDITDGSGLAAYINTQFDPALTWADLEWLRTQTSMPLVVKGIVRGDDAREAEMCGVRAIVVSNHGGRQLDTCIAPIDALPDVAEAVGDRVELLVDGGVRRGTDLLKAIARGARGVLLGRPLLWALAVGGSDGVERALAMVREEFDIALALCGAPSVADVRADLLA